MGQPRLAADNLGGLNSTEQIVQTHSCMTRLSVRIVLIRIALNLPPAAVPQGIFPSLGIPTAAQLCEVAGKVHVNRHTDSPPHFSLIGGIMSRAYRP